MLDYLVIAAFAFVLAGMTVWTIRVFKRVGRATYQAILPSNKGRSRGRKRPAETNGVRLSRQLESIPAPWGWPGYRDRRGRRIVRSGIVVLNGNAQATLDSLAEIPFEPTVATIGKASSTEIRGSQHGGYYVTGSRKTADGSAPLPWGW